MLEETHREVVARLLGVEARDVNPATEYTGNRRRYSYHLAATNVGHLFVKSSQEDDKIVRLQRQALAAARLETIGAPVNKVVRVSGQPFNLVDGVGIVAYELLDNTSWCFATGSHGDVADNQLPQLMDGIIRAVGRSICQFSGLQLPKTCELAGFRDSDTVDWRAKSVQHLGKVWAETNVVLEKLGQVFPGISDARAEKFRHLQEAGIRISQTLGTGNDEGRYLVHGDFDASQVGIHKVDGSYCVVDLESVGWTPYPRLAQFCDASNAWGRLWPRRSGQQQLVEFLYKQGFDTDFLRAMVVFGSFFLAKYAMDPNHHEHAMAGALLGNLVENLAHVDRLS